MKMKQKPSKKRKDKREISQPKTLHELRKRSLIAILPHLVSGLFIIIVLSDYALRGTSSMGVRVFIVVIVFVIALTLGIAIINLFLVRPRLLFAYKTKPESQGTTKKNNARPDSTVVEILLRERAKSDFIILLLLLVAVILSAVSFYYTDGEFGAGALSIPLLLLMAYLINRYAINYRIRRGYYGSTEYEAREIINFILKHSDKSDFSDGSGLRELFTEPERREGGMRDLVPSRRGTVS